MSESRPGRRKTRRRERIARWAALCLAATTVVHAQKPTEEQLLAALADPANAAFNEGYQAQTQGNYRAAAAAYDRAVELSKTDSARFPALRMRGATRGKLGLWLQARADLDEALRLAPSDAQRIPVWFALVDVARGQGDFRTAADTLKQLEVGVAKLPKELTYKIDLAVETARTTLAWGDVGGALEEFQEALPLINTTNDLAVLSRTQREIARGHLQLNDKVHARELALEALGTDLRRLGTSRRRPVDDWIAVGDRAVAQSMLLLADCQLAQGELAAARTNYRAVWQLAFKIVSPEELMKAELGEARCALGAVRNKTATTIPDSEWRAVLELREQKDFPAIRFEAFGLAGEMALARGDAKAASGYLQDAVSLVEEIRQTATVEERLSFLAAQADCYRWLIEAYLDSGDVWSALAASESLKARELRETLEPAGAAKETFEQTLTRLRTLPAALDSTSAILSYANVDWSKTEPVAFVITAKGLKAVRLPLRELPKLLATLPQAEVLAAQKREVDAQRYDLGDEIELAGVVAFFRECIDCPPNQINARVKPLFATAQVLGTLLFSPVLKELSPEQSRLLVSPNGLLAYLPFDMLMTESGRALVEDYAVTLTPSLLVSQSLAARPAGTYAHPLIAFGGAVYNPEDYDQAMADVPKMKQEFDKLTSARKAIFAGSRSPYAGRFGGPANNLAGTKAEVLLINETVPGSAVILGRDVSESNVRKLAASGELKTSRVIHFAVHGMAMPTMPALSGILLSHEGVLSDQTPSERDGFLQITEIEKLPIRAELVTLSACQTGLGAIIAGEGVVGMTRALFAAGADNVVASLWPVNDASSVYFMRRFYQLHLIDGLPMDVAIAHVKREFIAGKAGEFRHPQYWAPFNLYGGRELLGAGQK